jgi:hypothetical protein
MAWLREYNKGQKGVGDLWATDTSRSSESTNSIIWTSTQTWTVVQWTKEVK